MCMPIFVLAYEEFSPIIFQINYACPFFLFQGLYYFYVFLLTKFLGLSSLFFILFSFAPGLDNFDDSVLEFTDSFFCLVKSSVESLK